ncbi:mitochondrial inner membrane protease subunit Imp2 [Cordyceps javanica]|uniref:Mitochondrial inner membrane protease subunit 2 n=1 Tax=Cordyceps javanica TaxID=43265 RepID=A0A545VGB0_9HYPO|nr:mitochondrial inner membrane protease subunit Imp2 [Cordyceps javanica]TQW11937.1 mitochondrial inner membrane protease subunit Imp2 [Cordyceps javanica]
MGPTGRLAGIFKPLNEAKLSTLSSAYYSRDCQSRGGTRVSAANHDLHVGAHTELAGLAATERGRPNCLETRCLCDVAASHCLDQCARCGNDIRAGSVHVSVYQWGKRLDPTNGRCSDVEMVATRESAKGDDCDAEVSPIAEMISPRNPEAVAIKRIVGLEGDTVHTRPPYPFPKVKVPKGHVWIEGDGRPGHTIDSNTYGPVSKRLLVGRVTHILYPFHKFGAVKWWEHIPRPIERRARNEDL